MQRAHEERAKEQARHLQREGYCIHYGVEVFGMEIDGVELWLSVRLQYDPLIALVSWREGEDAWHVVEPSKRRPERAMPG
jgi:hypothetical protein